MILARTGLPSPTSTTTTTIALIGEGAVAIAAIASNVDGAAAQIDPRTSPLAATTWLMP